MLNGKKAELDVYEVKGVEFLHASPGLRARFHRMGSVECHNFPPVAALGFLEYPVRVR